MSLYKNIHEKRKRIKAGSGEKLGFSERARAVNKGLLPSKAKKDGKKKRS